MFDPKRTHLKVKIKTLAAESQIIKKEEHKALAHDGGGWDTPYDQLYRHRIDVVRPVARTNHLAYGYLRGRSYARMESCCHAGPNFREIEKIARRFCTAWDEAAWDVWRSEAKAHLKAQSEAQKAAA